jgi:hypothetical protein
MKKYSHEEINLGWGDKVALFSSRFMSTWPFIILLSIGVYEVIHAYNLLTASNPLDIFNVLVSLYTLFVDLILLRSAISQRNMDRALAEKMDKTLMRVIQQERRMIKLEETAIGQLDDLHRKVDQLLAR